MPFVLDNSVAAGWFLGDQADDYTEAIAVRLEDDRAVVPAVWELELANVLRNACLNGRLDAEAAQAVLAEIGALPIDVDRQPVAPSEVLGLALRFGLSSYDAVYLEVALRLGLRIATRDRALRAAALAAGVGVA